MGQVSALTGKIANLRKKRFVRKMVNFFRNGADFGGKSLV